jgi:hypothetical protein
MWLSYADAVLAVLPNPEAEGVEVSLREALDEIEAGLSDVQEHGSMLRSTKPKRLLNSRSRPRSGTQDKLR